MQRVRPVEGYDRWAATYDAQPINVVLALWERDEGREDSARALLRSSAPSYPGAPVQRAVDGALAAWPADFAAMTADPSLEVRYN